MAVAATGMLLAPGLPPARAAGAAWSEEWWFTDLDVARAWTVSQGAGVTVAVVDTGVVGTLGDLSGQVLPGINIVGSGDGRSDPGEGCNLPGGCFSHGTQMALLIAGTGAGEGFQGIAPRARILPVKVSASTGVDAEDAPIAQGIRWAVDHGAQIINVSLGASGICPGPEGAAIKYAYQHDVIVVAGSGNDHSPVISAIAACPGALGVGAVDPRFLRASFSDYGPLLDFVDPGSPSVEESLSGAKLPGGPGSGGTSASAAIASATLALIRSHFPHMSARDVVTHALYNVHNGLGRFGVRISDQLGYGEILPYHAMMDPLPANAVNPIYDQWASELGPPVPGGGTSSAPRSTHSGGYASSAAHQASSYIPRIPPVVIALIVLAALVSTVITIIAVQRSRRRPTPPRRNWNPPYR